MLDEQSKALPQFDGLPYGNQPPTRTTRTTTPQTFLELEVHLKRYQVHLYSDTPTPLSLLNSRFHHHCLSKKPGSMSFWHIFFVISPHFEKKRFHFFFFFPQMTWFMCMIPHKGGNTSHKSGNTSVRAENRCAAALWLADHKDMRITTQFPVVREICSIKWILLLQPNQLVVYLCSIPRWVWTIDTKVGHLFTKINTFLQKLI